MINFFYDSLDTLKTVKIPTTDELFKFVISVLVTLVISGLMFIAFDAISSNLYQMLYNFTLS